jgi:hypothetical protein
MLSASGPASPPVDFEPNPIDMQHARAGSFTFHSRRSPYAQRACLLCPFVSGEFHLRSIRRLFV